MEKKIIIDVQNIGRNIIDLFIKNHIEKNHLKIKNILDEDRKKSFIKKITLESLNSKDLKKHYLNTLIRVIKGISDKNKILYPNTFLSFDYKDSNKETNTNNVLHYNKNIEFLHKYSTTLSLFGFKIIDEENIDNSNKISNFGLQNKNLIIASDSKIINLLSLFDKEKKFYSLNKKKTISYNKKDILINLINKIISGDPRKNIKGIKKNLSEEKSLSKIKLGKISIEKEFHKEIEDVLSEEKINIEKLNQFILKIKEKINELLIFNNIDKVIIETILNNFDRNNSIINPFYEILSNDLKISTKIDFKFISLLENDTFNFLKNIHQKEITSFGLEIDKEKDILIINTNNNKIITTTDKSIPIISKGIVSYKKSYEIKPKDNIYINNKESVVSNIEDNNIKFKEIILEKIKNIIEEIDYTKYKESKFNILQEKELNIFLSKSDNKELLNFYVSIESYKKINIEKDEKTILFFEKFDKYDIKDIINIISNHKSSEIINEIYKENDITPNITQLIEINN